MSEQTPTDRPRYTEAEVMAFLAAAKEHARIQRRRAWWRLGIGLVVAIVAGVASLATYGAAEQEAALEAAQSGSGSGTYVVWWGPMALGGWWVLTAVMRLWRLRG
jgi:hypothetical protein